MKRLSAGERLVVEGYWRVAQRVARGLIAIDFTASEFEELSTAG